MSLLHPQLAAFAAVIEEASFEAAARRLSITPSAVSQRVKALEDRLGQVLIVRQAPCRPTPAGQVLLRRARPMLALEIEALRDFQLSETSGLPMQRFTIAVNDDSLATWVIPALAVLHRDDGFMFDVIVDDQDHSLGLLREGKVLGTITAEASALQGCTAHLLGTMRYYAVAAPAFIARYFAKGIDSNSMASAPMLTFNRKDELQARFIRTVTGGELTPPTHYLPSSIGFVEAAALGMGWCMVPDSLAIPARERGAIDLLQPDVALDVSLYWQHAAVRSDILARITQALTNAAELVLHTAK